MLYLIIATAVLVLVFLFNSKSKTGKRLLIMDSLKEDWAKPADNYRDISQISTYHDYVKTEHAITDSIATDIDLENIFNYVDRTQSKIGQQYLYHKLKSPEDDIDNLKNLDDLAESLTTDEQARKEIQMELLRLSHKNAYYLHQLFNSPHLPLYPNLVAVYIRFAGIIWIGAVVFTVILHTQFLFLSALFLTIFNFYLHYNNKKNVLRYLHSLPQLYLLMQVSRALLGKVKTKGDQAAEQSLATMHSLNRSLQLVNLEDKLASDPTDISYAVWELFKIILVIEPAMFIASINKVVACRDDIKTLFNYVGQIDTAISIQSFRQNLPYYSKPNLVIDHDKLEVEGLFHPLVNNCVANSILVSDNKGTLITGSNMSGKTTFIRAMAVNALLSQTLYTSCTKQYTAPLLQLFTSIRISDDMEEHKSYFQSEAISVLNIMKQTLARDVKSMVIIDEIFRGTNTIERVAAAKAILSYFTASRSFIFVSTHDLELAELLGDEYAVYCFEEKVADGSLLFDYKIKPGILRHKNAIAIMAALGYPETVITDAYAMSEKLREKYKI